MEYEYFDSRRCTEDVDYAWQDMAMKQSSLVVVTIGYAD